MLDSAHTARFLEHEARALLTRLEDVRSFAVTMPMVTGATIPLRSMQAIEQLLAQQRQSLELQVRDYIGWLRGSGRSFLAEIQQRRFTLLRLRFNASLDQLDIFADVLAQRCEHDHGTWLAGLDVVAAEALELAVPLFDAPPLLTYLDRGHGAAIRRARTRLPGGGANPVAIIRVPRERMVGTGVASSLVHEVGHQGAALLDLVSSLRGEIRRRASVAGEDRPAWTLWNRWISEIAADFWAVAKLGIAAATGLIGVVSLPRAFVFRIQLDDPHPFPWIRVSLSCALGEALYPDPQWRRLFSLWESFYPRRGLSAAQRRLIGLLETTQPAFVRLLVDHRAESLRGRALRQVMPLVERHPVRLRALFRRWCKTPARMCTAAPTLVLAVLGQARFDGHLSPEREARALRQLLVRWAVERAVPTGGLLVRCPRALVA